MNILPIFNIPLTVGQPYVTMSLLPNVYARGRNEQYRNGETHSATRLDGTPSPTSKRAYLYLRRQETGFENKRSIHCSREQDRPAHTCADLREVTYVDSTESQNVKSLASESLPDRSDNRPRKPRSRIYLIVQAPFVLIITTFRSFSKHEGGKCDVL